MYLDVTCSIYTLDPSGNLLHWNSPLESRAPLAGVRQSVAKRSELRRVTFDQQGRVMRCLSDDTHLQKFHK